MKSSCIVELRRISRQSEFHVFEAKWTNDTTTHGTRTRAMWHQTNEHLAHGKLSVIMHEISRGISSMMPWGISRGTHGKVIAMCQDD